MFTFGEWIYVSQWKEKKKALNSKESYSYKPLLIFFVVGSTCLTTSTDITAIIS